MSRLALVLGVIVAVAAMAVVAATSALQVAENGRPTLSPRQETELLAATAETRAAAGKAADEGKKAKLDPAYIKLKFAPPEEGLRAMAARTAVDMGETWGGTLEIINIPSAVNDSGPVASVSLASLGCSAVLEFVPIIAVWWYDDPKVPDPNGDPEWRGHYRHYRLTASAPGDSQVEEIAVWCKDDWGMETNDIPSGYTVVMVPELTADVQLSVSGLYLKRSRTATSYDDRQTMDW